MPSMWFNGEKGRMTVTAAKARTAPDRTRAGLLRWHGLWVWMINRINGEAHA